MMTLHVSLRYEKGRGFYWRWKCIPWYDGGVVVVTFRATTAERKP